MKKLPKSESQRRLDDYLGVGKLTLVEHARLLRKETELMMKGPYAQIISKIL